jgi:type I restriction enzyme S subunit
MIKYKSYKDSGVEWIGEIPEYWDITRLKYLGNLYGGLTGKSGNDFNQDDNPNNKPYIPYTNIFNNTYISKNHFHYVVLENGEKQNLVEKFDLFFLMSSETHQDLGKSCILIEDVDELYLNSFCKGFRVDKNNVNPLFLNYQLLGDTHKKLVSVEGRGFTRINLRQDRLNSLVMLLPPLPEQQQIVSFLDTKTSLIDTLIEKTQRKIELLKEQRTSLINHTITKGLNPNVEMKDSGVEWIGEIPEHWEITKMKYGVKMISEKSETISGDIKISPENVEPNTGVCFNLYSDYNGDGLRFQVGDILLNKLRLYLKKILITEYDGFSMGEMIVLRTQKKLFNKYFYFLLFNQGLIDLLDSQSTGIKLPRVSPEIILNSEIVYPPIVEQQQIVEYLDKKTTIIDTTITTEQKRIELLKEYRQSLISNVITGKIKVSNYE